MWYPWLTPCIHLNSLISILFISLSSLFSLFSIHPHICHLCLCLSLTVHYCHRWLQLGALQRKKKFKKPRLLWKWVGPGLTRNFLFCFGKSSQNSPKPVQIFWSSIQCVFCLYTLLKVVGYYDLSVLSIIVMDFQKTKKFVGGVSSIQVFFVGFLELF